MKELTPVTLKYLKLHLLMRQVIKSGVPISGLYLIYCKLTRKNVTHQNMGTHTRVSYTGKTLVWIQTQIYNCFCSWNYPFHVSKSDDVLYTHSIFSDVSKVFDKISFKILHEKACFSCGIKGIPLQLFSMHLSNRQHYTTIKCQISENNSCGAPVTAIRWCLQVRKSDCNLKVYLRTKKLPGCTSPGCCPAWVDSNSV